MAVYFLGTGDGNVYEVVWTSENGVVIAVQPESCAKQKAAQRQAEFAYCRAPQLLAIAVQDSELDTNFRNWLRRASEAVSREPLGLRIVRIDGTAPTFSGESFQGAVAFAFVFHALVRALRKDDPGNDVSRFPNFVVAAEVMETNALGSVHLDRKLGALRRVPSPFRFLYAGDKSLSVPHGRRVTKFGDLIVALQEEWLGSSHEPPVRAPINRTPPEGVEVNPPVGFRSSKSTAIQAVATGIAALAVVGVLVFDRPPSGRTDLASRPVASTLLSAAVAPVNSAPLVSLAPISASSIPPTPPSTPKPKRRLTIAEKISPCATRRGKADTEGANKCLSKLIREAQCASHLNAGVTTSEFGQRVDELKQACSHEQF